MAGAHPRDGIRASGTMSSPSARAVGGAALLIARGPPWRRARCALALWSIRRGAASRPAARGTWWSTARRDAPVLVTRRPPRRACRWRAAAAGEGSRWRGGDGRGSSHRPCALPQLPHGSRGDAPLTRLGPHLGPTIGTLFVVSACAGKHCCTSRAAREPPMSQPRTCSVTQRHASPLDAQSLQHPGAPMLPRRASRVVSFVLGFALGTGVVVLFSLLRTWFCA